MPEAMSENANHIISRFRWNTSFDQKERASELQQRLSSLSGFNMQREIAEVFDKICPPDQTWRIQSLELDLGVIELDNLEPDLVEKLRRQLHEKLIDLIIYMNRTGDPNIEILNRDESEISMLRSFLQHGLMPWNYKRGDGSVNQMLAGQLENNREATIEMMIEVASPQENVRKRMAWQFNEPNLRTIIEGLEPVNYTQIIDFSNELINIQSKETVVQAGVTDFRKQVWLWVLNYLLTERGTLFNKVAFMRSSIRQMAERYNISFNELFELIDRAVEKLSRMYAIKADFILTLKALSKEMHQPEERLIPTENTKAAAAAKLSVSRLIHIDPKNALNILSTYTGKDKLQNLFPFILHNDITQLLIKQAESKSGNAIRHLFTFINEIRSDKSLHELVQWLEIHLPSILWRVLVLHQAAPALLLELILKEIVASTPVSRHEQLSVFIARFVNDEKTKQAGLSATASQLTAELITTIKNPSLEHISDLIKTSANRQTFIGRLLVKYFSSKQLAKSEAHKKPEGIAILNYLLPGSIQLMQPLMKEYAGLLKQELKQFPENEITHRLTELFWQCVLNYSAHNGSREKIKTMFRKGVLFSFPLSETNVRNFHSANISPQSVQNNCRLNSGQVISKERLFELIRECLTAGSQSITHNDRLIHLQELINIALELHPKGLRDLITDTASTGEKHRKLIQDVVPFTRFSAWIASDAHGSMHEAMATVRCLHELLAHIAPGNVSDELMNIIWKKAWSIIITNHWSATELNELVRHTFYELAKQTQINAASIITRLKKKNFRMSSSLRVALSQCIPAFSNTIADELVQHPDHILQTCAQKGLLHDLCHHLIVQQQAPAWLGHKTEEEIKELIHEIIVHHPVKLLSILKHVNIAEPQMLWLGRCIHFETLINAITQLNTNKQGMLSILERFHASFETLSISGITGKEMQHLLFSKLVKAWTSDNWKLITAENIWKELIWEISTGKGISKTEVLRDLLKVKQFFPPALQVAVEQLHEADISARGHAPAITLKKKMPSLNNNATSMKGSIPVMNAGLVLLNSYIPMLLERLGVVSERKFTDASAASAAVHYLQFVVTGLTATEEGYLPLNKVLCGLALSEPVPDSIEMTQSNKELIEGLLHAAIGHWLAIGNCSVDGFRGNWLVRDGLLVEQEDKWELTVQKRAYDLLIHKSPFSFSIIKYPWMSKPLHVCWPY